MSKWSRDTESFWRLYLIGETNASFEDGLQAIAAHSRADDTPVPEGLLDE